MTSWRDDDATEGQRNKIRYMLRRCPDIDPCTEQWAEEMVDDYCLTKGEASDIINELEHFFDE